MEDNLIFGKREDDLNLLAIIYLVFSLSYNKPLTITSRASIFLKTIKNSRLGKKETRFSN